MLCNRARLQSCRKRSILNWGFSPRANPRSRLSGPQSKQNRRPEHSEGSSFGLALAFRPSLKQICHPERSAAQPKDLRFLLLFPFFCPCCCRCPCFSFCNSLRESAVRRLKVGLGFSPGIHSRPKDHCRSDSPATCRVARLASRKRGSARSPGDLRRCLLKRSHRRKRLVYAIDADALQHAASRTLLETARATSTPVYVTLQTRQHSQRNCSVRRDPGLNAGRGVPYRHAVCLQIC
jgi:hypothetical protein